MSGLIKYDISKRIVSGYKKEVVIYPTTSLSILELLCMHTKWSWIDLDSCSVTSWLTNWLSKPLSQCLSHIVKIQWITATGGQSVSHVWFCNPKDCSKPGSVGFPRQEYWNGLLFLSPGDLPNPGTEPASPSLAGRFFIWATQESHVLSKQNYSNNRSVHATLFSWKFQNEKRVWWRIKNILRMIFFFIKELINL